MSQKWAVAQVNSLGKYALNPRGNLWLNDENKFGLKLMSKMGWSQGKGLGKNENGTVEHIKVNVKDSKSGVGYNEKPTIPITAQTEEFESLLSELNEGHSSAKKSKNIINRNEDTGLEQRSQKFRKRLHYQKFVRGKDVSRYSDDDMKSIFILRKSLNKSITAKGDSQAAENLCTVNSESVESNKSNLNITEYFAKKMQEKIRSIALRTKSVGNSCQEVAFLSFAETKNDAELEAKEKTQSGKKRKRSEEEVSNSFQGEFTSEAEGLRPSKKSKKKSKKINGVYSSLKSCLKSKKSVNFVKKKEVSFNETVSYRIIECELSESDVESISSEKCQSEQLLNREKELTVVNNEAEQKSTVDNNEDGKEPVVNNKTEQESTVDSNETGNEPGVVNHESRTQNVLLGDPLEKYECFNIQNNDSSNFDSWITSQRQALKMRIYKNMMKKMKKHPIMKTTNLLQIKGYGNWGFE